jgi:hypothetical protein
MKSSSAFALIFLGTLGASATVGLGACSGDDAPVTPPPSHPDSGKNGLPDVFGDVAVPDNSAQETSTADTGAGNETGSEGGGGKMPFGASTCTQDSDCATGGCFVGGQGTFCTFHCTMPNLPDPMECTMGTGKCNMKMYCQVQ